MDEQAGTTTVSNISSNTMHWFYVSSMLVQRHRRWPSIEPTLNQCSVIAGLALANYNSPFLHQVCSNLIEINIYKVVTFILSCLCSNITLLLQCGEYLFIYLFIQAYLYRVKTLLAIGYFAYVPCFMTIIYIKYENRYLNNYHIYNRYNN